FCKREDDATGLEPGPGSGACERARYQHLRVLDRDGRQILKAHRVQESRELERDRVVGARVCVRLLPARDDRRKPKRRGDRTGALKEVPPSGVLRHYEVPMLICSESIAESRAAVKGEISR